jgi:hypothetical protein
MRTDKYIVTQAKPDEGTTDYLSHLPGQDVRERVLYLDNAVVDGAFYVATSWFWKATGPGPQAHVHDFDEVLAFFGTNPDDVLDLGGEVELWIDGEQHLMHRSFMAFIPAGLEHCPLRVTRVDRPIFHFSTGPESMYAGDKT